MQTALISYIDTPHCGILINVLFSREVRKAHPEERCTALSHGTGVQDHAYAEGPKQSRQYKNIHGLQKASYSGPSSMRLPNLQHALIPISKLHVAEEMKNEGVE